LSYRSIASRRLHHHLNAAVSEETLYHYRIEGGLNDVTQKYLWLKISVEEKMKRKLSAKKAHDYSRLKGGVGCEENLPSSSWRIYRNSACCP